MVGGGMKAMTQRTSEPEHFVVVAHLKIQQIDNNLIDGDLVSEHSEKIRRVMFCHYAPPMAEKILPLFRLPEARLFFSDFVLLR